MSKKQDSRHGGASSFTVTACPLSRKVALALAIPLLLAATLGGLRVQKDLSDAANLSTSAKQVTIIKPAIDYLVAAEKAMVAAHLSSTDSGEYTSAVIDARGRYKDLFEKKHGIRLGFMSFFVKAAALAARDVPAVNARIEGDEIVYSNYLDVSVAVSAPKGLVVPVIRSADQMSFAEIEKTIADFGKKAKEGTLSMDDMKGGTFTISNGGVFGGLMSTPIINPPQSAVLGLHRIEDRPVVRDGEIVIRPMMYIALSYDHRLIDGREAVTALKTIKEAIEDPMRMLIDL